MPPAAPRARLGAGALAGALLLVLLAPPPALLAQSWEQEFKQGIGSPDSNVRYGAVKKIDVNDRRGRDYLYAVLEQQDWYVRGAAAEVLAGAQGEALAAVQKEFERNSKPLVREGLVFSFALRTDKQCVPQAIQALGDRQFIVRRAAAFALARVQSREAVPALIEAWQKEDDARLQVRYREALVALTGEDLGGHPMDWANWWKAQGEGFVPVAERPKPEQGGGAGGQGAASKDAQRTVLRDVELTFTEAGSGGPLFVMPEYGYNKEYMRTALKALEGVARVFYIDLPPLSNFKNLPTVGGTGLPEYPIDRLVEAFDELRQQRKQEQIAILGHGMTAWVAMRYASRYPEHVSHLILVSTWPSGMAWGHGRQRLEDDGKRRGDVEQEHYAQTLLIDINTGTPNYQPQSQQEAEALRRMGWSCYFADRRDGLAWLLYPGVFRDMGPCIIPEFHIAKEKTPRVPTLIIYGSHPRALWTASGDAKALAKAYPGAVVVACPASNMLPMQEDHELFVKTLKGFFRRYKFRGKLGG